MINTFKIAATLLVTGVVSVFSHNGTAATGEWALVQDHGVSKPPVYSGISAHPGSRWAATSWTDNSGYFWLFGGVGSADRRTNDLWRLDPATGIWTLEDAPNPDPSVTNSYGVYTGPAETLRPGARTEAITWVDKAGDLWMFGGDGFGSTRSGMLSDLWRYDISTGNWALEAGPTPDPGLPYSPGVYTGPPGTLQPSARHVAGRWTDGHGDLWLFGGQLDFYREMYASDLWRFDISERQWILEGGPSPDPSALNHRGVYTTGTTALWPSARGDASAWLDAAGNFWIFGGSIFLGYDDGELNDLWRYNPATKEWIFVDGPAPSPWAVGNNGIYTGPEGTLRPACRYGAICWSDLQGDLWLWSGLGNSFLTDMWRFDVSEENWHLEFGNFGGIPPVTSGPPDSKHPGYRMNTVGWRDKQGDLWLYGGNAKVSKMADLWRYDTPPVPARNSAPIPQDDVYTVPEDSDPFTFDPRTDSGGGPDTDPEATQTLTIISFSPNAWNSPHHGTLTLTEAGFSYTPNVNYVGPMTFTYTVQDNGSPPVIASAAVTINVTAVDDDPPVAQPDFYAIYEDSGPYTFDPRLNSPSKSGPDSDPDSAQILTIPNMGTLAPANAGTLSFTTSSVTFTPALEFTGLVKVPYTITDNGTPPQYDTALITIRVAPESRWRRMDGTGTPTSAGTYSGDNLKPGWRRAAAQWTSPDGNFWLFGGEGGRDPHVSAPINDLWHFDTVTGKWTLEDGPSPNSAASRIPGVYTGAPGTLRPGARQSSSSWFDAAGDLWLFGGYGYGSTTTTLGRLNDLWRYDVSEGYWFLEDAPSPDPGAADVLGVYLGSSEWLRPGAREQAVSWIDNSGSFWLFGGYGYGTSATLSRLNDLWRFDTTSRRWILEGGPGADPGAPNTTGIYPGETGTPWPGARSSAAAWATPSGEFWLYGGDGYGTTATLGILQDLWRFDVVSKTWSIAGPPVPAAGNVNDMAIYLEPADGLSPGARSQATTWADASGDLWLFGGYGRGSSRGQTYLYLGTLCDLWRFDVSENEWILEDAHLLDPGIQGFRGYYGPNANPQQLASRVWPSSWTDPAGHLWMFGGSVITLVNREHISYNDFWTYRMSSNTTTTIASPDVYTLSENHLPFMFDPRSNSGGGLDINPDPAHTITITHAGPITPASAGNVSFTASSVTFTPADGFTGIATIPYTVSDDAIPPRSDSSFVRITINESSSVGTDWLLYD